MGELRVHNRMKRVCVASKIVDDEEDAEDRIENTVEVADDVSRAGRSRFRSRSDWMRPRNGTVRAVRHVPVHAYTVGSPRAGPLLHVSACREFGRNPKGWHDFSPMAASCSLPIFSISPSSHSLP